VRSWYQLETSGKKIDGAVYRHCYYNCRNALGRGIEACTGFRIATDVLDAAVLDKIADVACTPERAFALAIREGLPFNEVAQCWRTLITSNADVSRSYLLHLVERIEVHDEKTVVVPRIGGITEAETGLHGARQ